MNRKEVDLAEGALIKVQQMVKDQELIVFSKDEAAALVEVATFWGQMKGAIALGNMLGNALKWLVGFFAIWLAFKEGLFDWIGAGLK